MSLKGNSNRKSYSFQSAGKNVNDPALFPESTSLPKPIGIKTPLQLAAGNGLFEMHTDLAKQISDNMRNLILTNYGERLGFYDYGANLGPLLFDLGTEAADAIAISRIRKGIEKYMPFVALSEFQVYVDREDNAATGKVGIQITYKIPKVDNYIRSLEIMLYVGG
tara:strand:+ start:28 stop:522 length:495 start_codon:yes stop_codon:yes gene_type:complete